MSTIITFAACDTQHCMDIPIVNDTKNEPDETFAITLERPPGLNDRITLDPVDGVVSNLQSMVMPICQICCWHNIILSLVLCISH